MFGSGYLHSSFQSSGKNLIMNNKIFVSGGTGFLGYHVVLALLDAGYEVYTLVRNVNNRLCGIMHGGLHLVEGDLEHIEIVDVPNFDFCINFAWGGVNRSDVLNVDIQKQNIQNEMNLWKFSERHGGFAYIDAGSRQEYSFSEVALTERSECNPISEYGKGKLAAFQFLSEYSVLSSMKYIHPRIFSVYGYDDHPWSLVNSSIERMMKDEDMELGDCLHYWSFLHVTDLANAFVAIIRHNERIGNNEVFNIGSENNQPLRYFVERIKTICNSSSDLKYGIFKQNPESMKSVICDSSKLKELTGWNERISFEEGIKEIVSKKINLL